MVGTERESGSSEIAWPRGLRAERESAPAPRRAWYLTIGPAYLALFVWGPFFDPLWSHDIEGGGLVGLAGSAVAAAVACFGLFYLPMAIRGFRTGRRLGVVAASTFGTLGSEWLTGMVVAVAEILWFAVAIDYAVQATLLGLISGGMLPASVLANARIGTQVVRGPVVMGVALFWIFITGMAALLRLTGVIGALMKIYAPVALVLLTIAAAWLLPGVGSFASGEAFGGKAARPYGPHVSAFPVFTGFFAMASLFAVDWGATAARRRDVVVGGLLGIVAAGTWTAIMALLVVSGALGRLHAAHEVGAATAAAAPVNSVRWAIANGIGGAPAAVILILLGLAALAPACFSAHVFIRKLHSRWSGVRRIQWAWIGSTIAFLLIGTSWPGRIEAVDHMMGLVFAPMVGAMVGDFLISRGQWSGVRIGWNPPGLIAWVVGIAVRLVLDRVAPPAIASPVTALIIAALVYAVLSLAGRDRPATADEPSAEPGVTMAGP